MAYYLSAVHNKLPSNVAFQNDYALMILDSINLVLQLWDFHRAALLSRLVREELASRLLHVFMVRLPLPVACNRKVYLFYEYFGSFLGCHLHGVGDNMAVPW